MTARFQSYGADAQAMALKQMTRSCIARVP
jgi:hypothetical protein